MTKRHARGRVIASIWVGLFVLGVIAAGVFQDDDPNTDDAAGMGALVGVVGAALMVVYLALAPVLNRRAREPERASAPRAPGNRRRTALIVAAAVAGFAILTVGNLLTSSSDDDSPPAEPVSPETQTGSPDAQARATARVRAAARAANAARIQAVDCTSDSPLISCVVTFEGPACQLWLVGDEPTPLGKATDGRRGRVFGTSRAVCE